MELIRSRDLREGRKGRRELVRSRMKTEKGNDGVYEEKMSRDRGEREE